jgi:hypothetical protein
MEIALLMPSLRAIQRKIYSTLVLLTLAMARLAKYRLDYTFLCVAEDN